MTDKVRDKHKNFPLYIYKDKEKFLILQSIGIIIIKNRETKAVICTHVDTLVQFLIPIIQLTD